MPLPHYHVTAAIIRRNDKVLITKRPTGSHLAGYWEFPGGKQEAGEDLKSCLKREIAEELGMTVRVEEWFMTVEHAYRNQRISLHVFDCTPISGTSETRQCSEIKWVSVTDLEAFTFPPPDLKVIEKLKQGHMTDA
ncbi:MAG: 8-oxo-dGTP diphosphatase MutT [Deltaproteobacteria bacterium]|nr:8-oxo-dGTP diphosphatase MutT [Deltaproteobacteria bacterium]